MRIHHIALLLLLARPSFGQSSTEVFGRVLNASGSGVPVTLTVRSGVDSSVLGTGASSPDGVFRVRLLRLPAQVLLEAAIGRGDVVRRMVDSASVRRSNVMPIILRSGAAQQLARVEVRVKPQRRPSVFTYFEGEAASRTEQIGIATSDWLDPLSLGTAEDLLRASPEMMRLPGAGSSLIGAPETSNQVQVGGLRVPKAFVSGDLGGTLSFSPWDVTIGGVAGANANLFIGSGGRFRSRRLDVRTGASGVPAWTGSASMVPGLSVPLQVSGSSSGPLGALRYSGRMFLSIDRRRMSPWDDALDLATRAAVDDLSRQLDQPTILRSGGRSQVGLVGRVDFRPGNMKRVTAVTAALSSAEDRAGSKALFQTASVLGTQHANTAFLQLEDTRVLRERVLWSTQIGASGAGDQSRRPVDGPTVIVLSPSSGGGFVVAGASPPLPSGTSLAVEGRSTATWYSADNARRFVAQLQLRAERNERGAIDPHGTFVATPSAPSGTLQVLSFAASGATDNSRASLLLAAPAASVRQDLNKNGSLLIGVRADAWQTSRLTGAGRLSAVDISPRIALLQRVRGHAPAGESVATLRFGVGRFVDWPALPSWSDAWSSGSATAEQCVSPNTPTLSVSSDLARCPSASQARATAGVEAAHSLRPAAATRADASVSLNGPVPGVRAEFGVAAARTDRIGTLLPPILAVSPIGALAGEDGRRTYVEASQIGADGTVPIAPLPSGANAVSRRTAVGWSEATQLRFRVATKDPFASMQLDARYIFTVGRQHTQMTASRLEGMAIATAPLTAGGRHTVALSIGAWASDVQFKLTALARSGARFTPIADRDLNGDGMANDAVYVPRELSEAWASAVPSYVRRCIRAAAGNVAGVNSCTGPWSVQTQLIASITGRHLGMAPGSAIDVRVGNPLGLLFRNGADSPVTLGDAVGVNPTLLHVTSYDAAKQRFGGVPLRYFGTARGLIQGATAPVQVSVNFRIPLGPSVTDQRADAAIRMLASDRSARGRQAAAMQYVSDIPPIPIIVLQSAEAIQLTAVQRSALQKLGGRWQEVTMRTTAVVAADSIGGTSGTARAQLLRAREQFLRDVLEIAAETRRVLTPDQAELLPESTRRLLNPRFLRLVASFDAGM